MKIKGSDLILGIKKAKGVVDESSVIEHLRGFKFNPREDGIVEIAGSDGKITLLARIPYKKSEDNESEGILSISSEKIQELVKYINPENYVEFIYNEESDQVEIREGYFTLKTRKKEFENEQINFDIFNDTEFDDEVDTKEFLKVLNTLSVLLEEDYFDVERETIFLDGERAYIKNGEIACKIPFKTKEKYLINNRQAKQIIVLLNNSEGKKVRLKHARDDDQVVIKTSNDILSYFVFYTDFTEIDFVDEYKENIVFELNRGEFENSVLKTSIASGGEDEIYLTIGEKVLIIQSMTEDGEETAEDVVEIKHIKGAQDFKERIEARYMSLVRAASTAGTKEIQIIIDTENGRLIARSKDGEKSGKVKCLMSINFD